MPLDEVPRLPHGPCPTFHLLNPTTSFHKAHLWRFPLAGIQRFLDAIATLPLVKTSLPSSIPPPPVPPLHRKSPQAITWILLSSLPSDPKARPFHANAASRATHSLSPRWHRYLAHLVPQSKLGVRPEWKYVRGRHHSLGTPHPIPDRTPVIHLPPNNHAPPAD